jgi:hypothetical protein
VIISEKTSIPRLRDEYNFFPTLVEHNLSFFLYYREAHTNIDGCHGIDAIVNRFEIKTRMLMEYDLAIDRGDFYTYGH